MTVEPRLMPDITEEKASPTVTFEEGEVRVASTRTCR